MVFTYFQVVMENSGSFDDTAQSLFSTVMFLRYRIVFRTYAELSVCAW